MHISEQIRTDPLRFGQIPKELHTLTPICKDTQIRTYPLRYTQINTVPCNFVQIHIDPYKSTQDSYRSTPIPTDPLRFEQINTYSFILPQIHKDTLILTQNHATSYRSTQILSDTHIGTDSQRIAHNQKDP